MRHLYKSFGIGAVLIVLSAVFLVYGIQNAGKSEENQPYYTSVNALITDKEVFPDGLDSFADVTYTDLSGIERSGRIVYNGSANVGDTIQIDMSTHNPAVIGFADEEAEQRQNTEKSKNKLYAEIEIIAGILMLALGIFLIIRRQRSRQATAETAVPQMGTAKPVTVPNTETADADYDIEKILKKIDEKFPPKPMVKLVPSRSDRELSVFDSKLGGTPYMPADFEYPTGRSGIFEGRSLRLLAQLNFEKLPHIENFPDKGILQFFCSDDEEDGVYGLNFDNRTEQNGFRVIYHENIIADESRLMPKEKLPTFTDGGYGFPFKGEFMLKAETAEVCPVSAEDYHFEKILLEVLNKISGKEYKKIYELGGKEEEICEKIYEIRACEHTCIGGYPFFTQDDPRGYTKELADYDLLLFQCDSSCEDNSEDEIMWGDMGVANFFITEKDLKNRDFSRVAYNWDCG